ncbi:MAG: aminoacyl-tRNA hydrolase [Bacteroidetes bacterium]|nr:aminoacyl-tRNA hydrolase [Bacteroidota bacterium]
MKLIVGLGNPGSKYETTRHNAGFIVIDHFAELFKIKFSESTGDWLEGRLNLNNEEVILLKPMTYMNNSGIAIKEFMDRINEQTGSVELKSASYNNMLVIVDDFQIGLGSIRVRKKGSDGGHNGLLSIIYHLNTDEFPRMRIGIGKENEITKNEFIDFVLGKFTKGESKILKELMPKYSECIMSFINDGIAKTMNTFNRSFIDLKPEKEKSPDIAKDK